MEKGNPIFRSEDEYLAHYGIKGMRWGHHIKKYIEPTIRTKQGYLSPAQKNTGPTEDALKSTKQLVSTHYRYKDKKNREKNEQKFKNKNKLDEYSDKELQDYLNRKRLEKQVIDISIPEIKDGRDKLQHNLDILTTAVGIAGSLATIYATTHQANKKTDSKHLTSSSKPPTIKKIKFNNKNLYNQTAYKHRLSNSSPNFKSMYDQHKL